MALVTSTEWVDNFGDPGQIRGRADKGFVAIQLQHGNQSVAHVLTLETATQIAQGLLEAVATARPHTDRRAVARAASDLSDIPPADLARYHAAEAYAYTTSDLMHPRTGPTE